MDPGKRTFYLGRYNCIELLGTGPIGETYRAKIYGVAGFEKQFAVKRLYPQLSEDEAFVARFVRAASAFAALEHEGISRVHEVNAQGAHYYIVVDLVRGLDLRRLLDLLQQRGEALAPDAAMTIAVDIGRALEHAHGKTNVLPGGVLHLGLTAPSVMVTYEGDVKLVDVGLLAALMQPGWSDTDALTATLAYLAPEVWRAEGVDARADVFSLGVVLHELLGGTRVFISDRASELRKAIESGPPAPPPADPRLQQIVTRAMEPDPTRRFGSVEEMRVEIQGILGGRVERARADLSALVRRLSAPRDRRTGAFAAVTLPPAATGMTSPVTATKPPPMPPPMPAPHTWAPPTPRPPVGATLSPIPVHNTLAGIGPDDQALVPIELVELPGLPTEKAMPTVRPDDAETNRVPRAAPDAPTPPPATEPARGAEPAAVATAKPEDTDMAASPSLSPTANAPATGSNGETAPEPSWEPPQLAVPPPSPEPLFAAPEPNQPAPVEPAKSTVPGMKLPPPRRGGTAAVLGSVGLLAAVGGLAIYAGLSGSTSTMATAGTAQSQPTIAGAVLDAAHGEHIGEAAAGSPVAAAKNQMPAAPSTPTAKAAPSETPTPLAPSVATPPSGATTPSAPTTSAEATKAATSNAATPAPKSSGQRATRAPVAAAPNPANPTNANPAPPSAAAGPTFSVSSTPDGAALFVDGESQGTTPAQIAVAPGRHTIVLLGEGQKMVKQTVDVVPGGHLDVPLTAAKLPPPIAGSDGLKVRCRSHGELRIFVDGEDSGRTCPNDERISVAAGPHKIGLWSARTGEMHEVEHEVTEGNNSTRVYVRY